MSNMQYMNIGDFMLGVPNDKMFDVATLQIDIRPAVENLMRASPKRQQEQNKPDNSRVQHSRVRQSVAKSTRYVCRKGCKRSFVGTKHRRTHERKYHGGLL